MLSSSGYLVALTVVASTTGASAPIALGMASGAVTHEPTDDRMTLPFVSRAHHEATVAQLRADLAASDDAIEWFKRLHDTDTRRYDALLDKYH